MTRMLVIADDFTGALDTGIQFVKKEISTQILLECELLQENLASDVQVAVIDSETRHLSAEEAGNKICRVILAARAQGIKMIYKKTDSALRGNIGSELAAQMAVTGQDILVYIPAFPKAGRTTLNGVQYVNGVPVSESVFGQDPFEPVKSSYIPDIIARQSSVNVKIVTREEMGYTQICHGQPAIYVFDAERDEDLKEIAGMMKRMNVNSLAGCAGFAEYLPDLLREDKDEAAEIKGDYGMIVISGSINPITLHQIRRVRKEGVQCFTLNRNQKISRHYAQEQETEYFVEKLREVYERERKIVIEASDSFADGNDLSKEEKMLRNGGDLLNFEASQLVADNLAEIVYAMVRKGIKGIYVFIGGDTMAAVMKRLECKRIVPQKELMPGIVFSKAIFETGDMKVISKSGGFGEEDVLVRLFHEVKMGDKTYG